MKWVYWRLKRKKKKYMKENGSYSVCQSYGFLVHDSELAIARTHHHSTLQREFVENKTHTHTSQNNRITYFQTNATKLLNKRETDRQPTELSYNSLDRCAAIVCYFSFVLKIFSSACLRISFNGFLLRLAFGFFFLQCVRSIERCCIRKKNKLPYLFWILESIILQRSLISCSLSTLTWFQQQIYYLMRI